MDEGTSRLHARHPRCHSSAQGGARRGDKIRRCGVGTRYIAADSRGPRLLSEAQRRPEHTQALRPRRVRRQGAAAGRPRPFPRAGGQAQCHRLFPAFARQQIRSVRNLGRRLGAERAARARGRQRQGNRRCDRSRQLRDAVVPSRRAPALQPPAEARGRRAGHGQIPEPEDLRSHPRHRSRQGRARARRRALPGGRDRSNGIRICRASHGLELCSRRRHQRHTKRVQALLRAPRVAQRQQDALGQDRGQRGRCYRRGGERRLALSAHAQECVTLQDRARFTDAPRSRQRRSGRAGRRRRHHRNCRRQGCAVCAADARRDRRHAAARVRGGRQACRHQAAL